MRLDPMRRGAEHGGAAPQMAGHPAGVLQIAEAQRQIHARLDQVYGGVIHQQAQPQLRMHGQPLAERRCRMLGKAGWGGQTQLAAGALVLGGQFGACPAGSFAHGGTLDVEALAGISQRQLARGAVQ